MNGSLEQVSLLDPGGLRSRSDAARLSDQAIADLALSDIAARIAAHGIGADEVLGILTTLHTDVETIEYRQAVVEDLMSQPELARLLKELLPKIAELTWYNEIHRNQGTPLLQAIWRLGELELYVDCVEQLHALFERFGGRVSSEGLHRVRTLVDERRAGPDYRALADELPRLREGLRRRKSVTLGINLDDRLRPVEAAILSVNDAPFHEQALLTRLLGRPADAERFETAVPLHSTPRPLDPELYPTGAFPLAPLFQDLEKLLGSISRPLVAALKRYVQVSTAFLHVLRPELAFYLGAVDLLSTLRAAGMPLCRPRLLPIEERRFDAAGFYNLHLALLQLKSSQHDLRSRIVANDASFDDSGRIFILTGPNQGGKTTYTQALGLIQLFAQAGLPVPAERASISPVDHVITHFPVEEKGELEQGRLAEEAARFAALFQVVTRHSLVLLNESLSSTSPGESLYLAEDIVSAFRLIGTRAVFATHLHELAYRIDEINANVAGDSLLVSLVAGVAEHDGAAGGHESKARRTYRINVGPPIGKSYARDIAEQYGISLERLSDLLKRRGLVQ